MTRPAMTYFYAIAGRFFCIEASDEWAGKLAENFLSGFRLDSANTLNSSEHLPYIVRISSQASVPSVPSGLETFAIAFGQCSTDGTRYYLQVDGSLMIVEPEASLEVWIGKTAGARQALALVNVMAYALEISLRRSGLYQLHGAGVVPPGHHSAALFLGSSGSGKSTLAAVLASRGWSYLTDDSLLLDDEGDMIAAKGIRRFFAATEATLASCSLLGLNVALGGQMLSDPSKRLLEPEVAFPGRFMASCIPSSLFFSAITEERASRVLPLTQSETMARLVRSNPWAGYDRFSARDHLGSLSKLATQCRSFSLLAGRDVLDDPSLAEALLRPLI